MNDDTLTLMIKLPPDTTLGDWEKLANRQPDAVSIPSQIAMQIAHLLGRWPLNDGRGGTR